MKQYTPYIILAASKPFRKGTRELLENLKELLTGQEKILLNKHIKASTQLLWAIDLFSIVAAKKTLTDEEAKEAQEKEVAALKSKKVDQKKEKDRLEVEELLRVQELQQKKLQQRKDALDRMDEIAALNDLGKQEKESIILHKWDALDDACLNPEEMRAVQGFLLKEEILTLDREIAEFEQSLSPEELAEFAAVCG